MVREKTIVLTSIDDFSRRELRELRVADCSAKPVRREELRRSLVRAVSVLAGGEAAPSADAASSPRKAPTSLRAAGDRIPPADPPAVIVQPAPLVQRVGGKRTSTGSTSEPRQSGEGNPPVQVLLAEDTPLNAEVVLEMLAEPGYQVSVVETGRAAVEAYQTGQFDLILMDCQMPDMDGFEAARAIREIEHSRKSNRIPIIAVTANALGGDRDRCLTSGMDDYLAKPFTMETLLGRIRRWTSGRSRPARDRAA